MGVAALGRLGSLVAPPPEEAWRYPAAAAALPSHAFTPRMLVRNQGSLGSCTGFAWACVLSGLFAGKWIPSPLALYWTFRRESGIAATKDDGAFPEPCARALSKYGAGSEVLWPYLPGRFADPPPDAYWKQAADHRIDGWYRTLTVASARSALVAGLPIALAIQVPPGFDQVGVDGEWRDAGGAALGGHLIAVVGYDDDHGNDGAFLVQNSWGPTWGTGHPVGGPGEGFLWVPYGVWEARKRVYDAIASTRLDSTAGG